jgi:phage-related holin
VPADSRRVAAFVGLFGANEMTILVDVFFAVVDCRGGIVAAAEGQSAGKQA